MTSVRDVRAVDNNGELGYNGPKMTRFIMNRFYPRIPMMQYINLEYVDASMDAIYLISDTSVTPPTTESGMCVVFVYCVIIVGTYRT